MVEPGYPFGEVVPAKLCPGFEETGPSSGTAAATEGRGSDQRPVAAAAVRGRRRMQRQRHGHLRVPYLFLITDPAFASGR